MSRGRPEVNILMGGEAGQGLRTVGEVLAQALVRSGYSVHVTQTYHSRVRGGHNTIAVRCGIQTVRAPRETVDLLVALNEETVDLHQGELSQGGFIIADASIDMRDERGIPVPLTKLSQRVIPTQPPWALPVRFWGSMRSWSR